MNPHDSPVRIHTTCFPTRPEASAYPAAPTCPKASAPQPAEYHATIRLRDGSLPFAGQLRALMEAYSAFAADKTVLLRRFFLSDPANQADLLEDALRGLPAAATSVVGQPPLDGTKIAAWVYAVSGGEQRDGVFAHNGYRHVWTGGMTSGEAGATAQATSQTVSHPTNQPQPSSEPQTANLFKTYDASLAEIGMDVAANCLRTWIFVRDVDANYGGVVKGRRDYFGRIGLTPDTHFIASTGIAGFSADPRQLVRMDAYAADGLQEGQVRYLHAYDHLSPTALYGVTFERGTSVTYGDRRHIFISGTASIDKAGKVLHEGDPARQTERMLENVDALLREAGAGFDDIRYSLVYLRDAADYPRVREVLERDCPALDPIYVLAPVCRPAWLVEMECMAITGDGDTSFAAF